ncbi:unnamed protein product, partial [Iphiclides podalirius]
MCAGDGLLSRRASRLRQPLARVRQSPRPVADALAFGANHTERAGGSSRGHTRVRLYLKRVEVHFGAAGRSRACLFSPSVGCARPEAGRAPMEVSHATRRVSGEGGMLIIYRLVTFLRVRVKYVAML